MSTGDHDDIRDLLTIWVEATRAKDAGGIIACQSEAIRTFALAPPLAGAEGPMFTIMPYVIIVVALAQFSYARAVEKKGLLH